MILNNVEEVIKELKVSPASQGWDQSDRTAQKGLDLIASLHSIDGPEKWIAYNGHLTLALYHAPRFGFLIDGKRARSQVWIDPRPPSGFGEVHYLLPAEQGPWTYASGYAQDVPTAAAMIIDALKRCEQRDEHLYETFA
jgi:hypothetical protein